MYTYTLYIYVLYISNYILTRSRETKEAQPREFPWSAFVWSVGEIRPWKAALIKHGRCHIQKETTWMSGWKLGSLVSKWVISPT